MFISIKLNKIINIIKNNTLKTFLFFSNFSTIFFNFVEILSQEINYKKIKKYMIFGIILIDQFSLIVSGSKNGDNTTDANKSIINI